MDSGRREVATGEWADLPAELLAIIHGELPNCREIIGFRSVCRWWRFSTPPPPNKLSGVFPLKPSFLGEPFGRFDFVINASAVYLIRSRSNAWMVAVQEASPGKLVLRHPLFYKNIFTSALDIDWIPATQTPIARFYTHNARCMRCNQVSWIQKVAFVRESWPSSSSGSGCSQLVGLCGYPSGDLFSFRMELGDSTTPIASQFHQDFHLHDIVTFNGRIFAIDMNAHIYLLDHTSLKLVRMNSVSRPEDALLNFVVSDGNLYLVVLRCEYRPPFVCHIYRLQVVVTHPNNQSQNQNQILLLVEKVEDLGDDRVFFIGLTCSFSVSARHLPPPWKGNCIFFGDLIPGMCECRIYTPTPHLFILGGQNPQCIPITSLQGYSDLFFPPAAPAAAAN